MSDETNVLDPQDTPAGGEGNEGGTGGGNETYFLEVDDRTRYRTAEEAAEGYREAGQRIAELTPWQATAQEYGLTDPNEVAALLDELAELRAARSADSGGRGNEGRQTNAPAPAATANLDPNSPEGKEAAALAWLKEKGVAAGYVNQETLNALQERMDSLTQETERIAEERFEQRMEYGHNVVKNELQAAGFYPKDTSDAKAVENGERLAVMLEQAMTAWVNESQARINAFHQGGPALTNLVKQGLNIFLPSLNVLKNSSGAQISATRGNANRPRVATNNGKPAIAAKPAPRNTGALKPEDGLTPEVHDAAWAAFEAARKGA
jgi:hypothetical protein